MGRWCIRTGAGTKNIALALDAGTNPERLRFHTCADCMFALHFYLRSLIET